MTLLHRMEHMRDLRKDQRRLRREAKPIGVTVKRDLERLLKEALGFDVYLDRKEEPLRNGDGYWWCSHVRPSNQTWHFILGIHRSFLSYQTIGPRRGNVITKTWAELEAAVGGNPLEDPQAMKRALILLKNESRIT